MSKILINTTELLDEELDNVECFSRKAVRGIAIDGDKILTIYSNTSGDYSVPGGGVDEGETLLDGLKREVKEETGYDVTSVNSIYVELREVHKSKKVEDNCDYFENLSYYYLVDVSDIQGEPKLTESEIREQIETRWEDLDTIISNNEELLKSCEHPRWVIRETLIFKYIRDNYMI